MTSTSFNIGLGDSTRNSSKVLKPPGGGSSDIFGAAEAEQSPRRIRSQTHLQSSVFGSMANGNETPSRNKAGNDSHQRLFGPADSRPASCTKDRQKSSFALGNDDPTSPRDNKDVEKTPQASARRNPVTGDGMCALQVRRSAKKRDGNPVTGEGYGATNGTTNGATNVESKESSPTSNGIASNHTNSTHSAPPQRTRVPPGGFSSGLW